jgi:PTH1 family peptidyl-tRNA hydrolase
MVVEILAGRWRADKCRERFQGQFQEVTVGDEKIGLLKPSTYMNESGQSVRAAVEFFKLLPMDLMVVCDDLNLPLGRLRIRAGGSAGGQKGLANIIESLGTDVIPRLRIGIGSPPPNWDAVDYVLGRFSKDERVEIDIANVQAADAIDQFLREGLDKTMNHYNRAQIMKPGNG